VGNWLKLKKSNLERKLSTVIIFLITQVEIYTNLIMNLANGFLKRTWVIISINIYFIGMHQRKAA